MTPERFLQLYPDPAGHFTAQGRAAPGTDYRAHAAANLLARFPLQAKAKVEAALRKYKCYIHTVRYLESQENTRKTMRNPHELKAVKPRGPVCLEFLKKKKFLELESNISRLKVEREAEQAARLEQARAAGLLQECQCCYAEGCLEEQMVPCKAGHLYCTECVARAAEVAAGDNKTAVGCFGDCDQEIDWRKLDRVVEPRLLSKLLQRRQSLWQRQEVNGARLEGLVDCPFCKYATMMDSEADGCSCAGTRSAAASPAGCAGRPTTCRSAATRWRRPRASGRRSRRS